PAGGKAPMLPGGQVGPVLPNQGGAKDGRPSAEARTGWAPRGKGAAESLKQGAERGKSDAGAATKPTRTEFVVILVWKEPMPSEEPAAAAAGQPPAKKQRKTACNRGKTMNLDKETLIKHRFWILLGATVPLVIVAILILVFKDKSEIAKKRTENEAKAKAIKDANSGDFFNEEDIKKVQALLDELS